MQPRLHLPFRAGRSRWIWLVLAVLLASGAALGSRYLWAWHHLRAAEAALERYHAEEARRHLECYLKVWPESVRGQLSAARAARRLGDAEAAERHLRTCRRLQPGKSEEIDLEWALLQVALGDLDENRAYVLARVQRRPAETPLVLEALAEGYTRLYRINEAARCLDRWLATEPDNVQALFLRGNLWWRVQVPSPAIPDFRRVLQIDPQRHEARWRLASCLAQTGGYDEALPLLEETLAHRPDDPEVRVDLARCEYMLGRHERGLEILDEVLHDHPDDELALRTRGQFALLSGQPVDAEKWLRRAMQVSPTDHQASWSLAQSLRQQGKTAESAAEAIRSEKLKDQRARLGDILTRQMAATPNDAELHAELGTLFIAMGHGKVGESWLLSALRLDPKCKAAHAALAEYYRKQGDEERAGRHQRER
jgi:tetratricopeptide (TPR) repeat protein